MKKVLLLTTGGTIAAKQSDAGLLPQIASQEILAMTQSLQHHFKIVSKDIFSLDSSNIQAEEWQTIARAIAKDLEKYDGFVVTHGTDTMAYTASMLSYMLQNLKKPVVLTGSQMPMDSFLSDARENLHTAFSAVDANIPGVTIAFHHKIISGCRAVKTRTMSIDAFESVNAPYLGEVYADGMHLYPDYRKKLSESTSFTLKDSLCTDVFLFKLIPSTNPDVFDMFTQMHYRGIVLETFGAGGMHYIRRNLLPKIEKLIACNITVAACSQCLYERSDFSIYEVGRRLLASGVIPSEDMTKEALVTKMMWALGQTDDAQKVREIFDTDYAGEINLSRSHAFC